MNTISKFFETPFSKLTLEQKLDVKKLGRPCPAIIINQSVNSAGKKGPKCFNRVFSLDYYKKYDWLCGCETKNKLYCFPCVLFRGDKVWSTEGFSDLNHLAYKGKQHENSKLHMQNVTSYAFLGKANIGISLSDAYRKSVLDHNRKVDENRYVLNIVINCIKFCGSFELALRGHDEGQTSLNPGVFRGLINFSAELDSALKSHIEKSTVFSGLSKTIQNDILECMLMVCQDEIKKEISSAHCFSVIADETSDVTNIFQMAIVFRYLLDGQPVERFFQFLQPSGHDAESLTNSIIAVLSKIEHSQEKLIGQTYDGASVMSGGNKGVQTRIKEIYPKAHFVHCFAHQLNLVLTKAMSINSSVRVFFANLTGLCTFFSQSAQRTAVLDEVVKRRLPRSVPTRWNFNSRSVNTVFESKNDLLECLKKIRNESFNHVTINQATGFVKILEDYSFNFWLKFCHPLMIQVDILYAYLQKRDTDAVGAKRKIELFEKKVNGIRNAEVGEEEAEEEPQCKRKRVENEALSLRRQAKEVCDLIIMEVRQRFSFTGHLSAATLLNKDRFASYRNEFPRKLLTEVAKTFELEEARMKTELEVVYASEEFAALRNALEFAQVIGDSNLGSTLREVNKLCTILAASPISSSEAERAFSALKRVKTFLRNAMGHSRLNALAMLSIEKELVHRTRDFNARVIDHFVAMKDRRIELLYK